MAGFTSQYDTPFYGSPSQSYSSSKSGSKSSGVSSGGTYFTPDQQAKMNQLWPGLVGQVFGQPGYRIGMAGGVHVPTPHISTGQIWGPQQIQEQVNLTRATNEQRGAGDLMRQQQDLTGRGYGSGSPIMAALGQVNRMGTMATNTAAENNLRTQMAQMNSQHLLQSQQAAANAALGAAEINQKNRNLDLQLYGQQLGRQGNFLSALAPYFQPLSKSYSQQKASSYSTSGSGQRGGTGVYGGFEGY